MIYPEKYEYKTGFAQVREQVKSLCVSQLGAEQVALMTFSNSYEEIDRQLRPTAEMLAIINGDDDFPLNQLRDITPVLLSIRVPGTFIPAQELSGVRGALQCMADVAAFFSRHRNDEGVSQFPNLDTLSAGITPTPRIIAAIDRIADRYGNIKDNASAKLASIRNSLASTSGTINSIMRRVISRAVNEGYLEPDATPAMRDGRLVLPVAPAHKRKISGIVHDESASGKTYFIEPAEIVEANNRIRELQLEERREITRILTALADEMRPDIDSMLEGFSVMGIFDFIQAKALYAWETGASLPRLSRGNEMEWYHATHPVLLESLRRQGKEIVPLDITLTPENRILIISGPNAGGKSVCLKTVGIVQYMMQCGMLPPLYENSHMGIFESIFIDIGDDQSLEDDLSTYSSHLRNMKQFVSHGNDRTLILIDEFGSGTEPQIGGAIAQAILREFNDRKMWGVINTHYQNIKHMAEETPGLVNGSMMYDRHLMQPMFRLSIGNPGSSFALEIARKTGLPQSIIAEAERIVGSDYVNIDKYLLDITRDKRYWENKRSAIKLKEKKLDNVLQKYEEDADTLREKRREIIAEAKEEARRILEGSNATIERAIHDIRRSQADKERTREAREKLNKEKERLGNHDLADRNPLLAKAPKSRNPKSKPAPEAKKPVAVGDNVKLDGQGTPGKVLEISGKNAVVVFGMLKTTVKVDRLQPTMSQPKSAAAKSSFVSSGTMDNLRERQLNFKQEIDVRGMRADEAIQAVTYFIDDAIQFNSARVRILHGTGTGALRQSLRQYLDTVSGVARYHDEDVRFGGAGITVVELD